MSIRTTRSRPALLLLAAGNTAVDADGRIETSKTLADIVNASAAKDIRAARAALARALP